VVTDRIRRADVPQIRSVMGHPVRLDYAIRDEPSPRITLLHSPPRYALRVTEGGALRGYEALQSSPNPSRQVIRKMLREENALRDQRLSYVLTINGFLFAGLGFAWNGPEAKRLVVLLAVFGVAIALITMQAMATSSQAFAELKKRGESPGWGITVGSSRHETFPRGSGLAPLRVDRGRGQSQTPTPPDTADRFVRSTSGRSFPTETTASPVIQTWTGGRERRRPVARGPQPICAGHGGESVENPLPGACVRDDFATTNAREPSSAPRTGETIAAGHGENART